VTGLSFSLHHLLYSSVTNTNSFGKNYRPEPYTGKVKKKKEKQVVPKSNNSYFSEKVAMLSLDQ